MKKDLLLFFGYCCTAMIATLIILKLAGVVVCSWNMALLPFYVFVFILAILYASKLFFGDGE